MVGSGLVSRRSGAELHDLPGRARIGRLVIISVVGFVGSDIAQRDGRAGSEACEFDDHVGPRRRRQKKLLQPDRGAQVAAIASDQPHLNSRIAELEDKDTRIAAVQYPQAVAARFDRAVRPSPPVHHHAVAEKLGNPDRRHVAGRNIGPAEAIEEKARLRVEKRPVRIEGPVLDRKRDLILPARQDSGTIAARRCRMIGRIIAADEVEAGEAGILISP